MQYELYRHKTGAFINQWGWRLRAANGRIIAVGGESYHNRVDCIDTVNSVMDTDRNTRFVEL